MHTTSVARFTRTGQTRLANARAIVAALEGRRARGAFLTRTELCRLANAQAILRGAR